MACEYSSVSVGQKGGLGIVLVAASFAAEAAEAVASLLRDTSNHEIRAGVDDGALLNGDPTSVVRQQLQA